MGIKIDFSFSYRKTLKKSTHKFVYPSVLIGTALIFFDKIPEKRGMFGYKNRILSNLIGDNTY